MKMTKRKIISIVLCLTMILGCLNLPGFAIAKAKAEAPKPEQQAWALQQKLGDGWSCEWNGFSDIPYADFVEIVSTEHHLGNNALRIGHPTSDTNLTLRRVITLSDTTGAAYEYEAFVKSNGKVGKDTAIYIKNGKDGVGGESKGYLFSERVGKEWAKLQRTDINQDGVNATDMWITTGEICIEIVVDLQAGTYLYIDDLNVVKTGESKQLLPDASFERWTGIRNGNTSYNVGEFVTLASDESPIQGNYVRIGHATEETDLTLQLRVPTMTEKVVFYDVVARVGGNGVSGGSVIRLKDGIAASGVDHVKEFPLDTIGSDWVWIDNTGGNDAPGDNSTNNVWGRDCVVELDIKCPAGGYLYLDNLNIYNQEYTAIKLNVDSGFEAVSIEELKAVPVIEENTSNIPNWEVKWEDSGVNKRGVTRESHSGAYALTLQSTEKIAQTYGQTVTDLQPNESYVFEGWVEKRGEFEYLEILFGQKGANGKIPLKDLGKGEYVFVTGTFTPDAREMELSVFAAGAIGSSVLADDFLIYKNGDTTKTNLIKNGDFEEEINTIGTTYYVDSVEGLDTNAGTSEKAAWKSLEKVNATHFNPGDKILFRAGRSWVGHLYPLGSGSAEAPIIIDMYGEGQKPLIIADGSMNYAVHLFNQQYWEINNLEVTAKSDAAMDYGIISTAKDCGTINHVYIKNCYVHDILNTADRKFGAIVIQVAGNETRTKYNDVVVENNTVRNSGRTGIQVDATGSWDNRVAESSWEGSTNVVFRGNFVDEIWGDGIVMKNCEDGLLEYNTARRCNIGSEDQAHAAIWVFNSSKCVMQYNEAYETAWNYHDGMGYDIDSNTNSTTVQYNYSHDNGGGFIIVCVPGDGVDEASKEKYEGYFNRDSIVRYNISQNDGNGDGARIFNLNGKITNTQIYNNTLYVGDYSQYNAGYDVNKNNDNPIILIDKWIGAFPSGASFENNLIYSDGTNVICNCTDKGNITNAEDVKDNITFSNNMVTGEAFTSARLSGFTYEKYAGLANVNSGITGINTLAGYQLNAGSPAIGAGKVGIDTDGTKDYFGNSTVAGKRNIGAYGGNGVDTQSEPRWSALDAEGKPLANAAEYIQVIPVEGARGNYALRIGNAEKATNVKLQCDVYFKKHAVYEWNAYVKSQGILNAGSQISITNMVANDRKPYLMTEVSDLAAGGWCFLQNSDKAGSKTDMEGTINGEGIGHIRLEIAVDCEKGNYLYVDDINLFKWDWGYPFEEQTVLETGFENWVEVQQDGNRIGVNDSEVFRVVNDTAMNGEQSLCIGSDKKATDVRLELLVPVVPGDRLTTQELEFYCSAMLRTKGTLRKGSGIYIQNAKDKSHDFLEFDESYADWTYVGYTNETQSPKVTVSTYDTAIRLTLVVKCDKGNYLYVDNVSLNRAGTAWEVNLLSDGSFENQKNYKDISLEAFRAYASQKLPNPETGSLEEKVIADVTSGIQDAKEYSALERAVTTAYTYVDAFANENKLNVGGKQIRTSDQNLRFVLEIDDFFYDYVVRNFSRYGDVEFGTLLARTDMYTGTLEYSNVTRGFSRSAATTIKRTSTYKPEVYKPINEGRDTTVYTCVVRGIPESSRDTTILARNYLKYTGSDGTVHYVYGTQKSASYNGVLEAYAQMR